MWHVSVVCVYGLHTKRAGALTTKSDLRIR